MAWARLFWIRLQSLILRDRNAHQLDDEIEFHLEQQIAENLAAGMSPEEARYAAMRTFGNPAVLKEETRDTWGWIAVEQIAKDLRYGLRMLRRNPGFSAVAVVTLALGIGANAAIFTVINAVMLRALPVKHPDGLVTVGNPARVHSWGTGTPRTDSFSYPLYRELRDNNQVFSSLLALGVAWSDTPSRVAASARKRRSSSSWDLFFSIHKMALSYHERALSFSPFCQRAMARKKPL